MIPQQYKFHTQYQLILPLQFTMSRSPDNHNLSFRQRPKRKRTPSQYTTQITFLKQQVKRNNKLKQETSISQEVQQKDRLKEASLSNQSGIRCKLPNGKQFQISIVLKSKNRQTKPSKIVRSPQKVKEKDQAPKSLLDIFQSALFKVQMNQDEIPTIGRRNQNWEGGLLSKESIDINMQQLKTCQDKKLNKRQKDYEQQKVMKTFERINTLNAKLQQAIHNTVII